MHITFLHQTIKKPKMRRVLQMYIIATVLVFSANSAMSQYIKELCPKSEYLKNEGRYEEWVQYLNICLEESTNKSDSLLIYGNLALALNSTKKRSQADSIISVLISTENQKYYKSYILALERIARTAMMKDRNEALRNFLLADSLSKVNGFTSGMLRNKVNLANIYYIFIKDYEIANKFYSEALKFDDIPTEYYLTTLSGAYDTGNKLGKDNLDSLHSLSLVYIKNQMVSGLSSRDSSHISTFYGMVGKNLFKSGQLRLALEQNLEAVKLRPKARKFQYGLSQLYFNISKIFLSLSNTGKAMEYAEIISRNADKYEFKAYSIQVLALKAKILKQQGEFAKAKKKYTQFITRNQNFKINEKSLLLTAYADLAFIYSVEDSMALSKEYLEKAKSTIQEFEGGGVPLMTFYSAQCNYYIHNNQYEEAKQEAKKLMELSTKFNDTHYIKTAAKYLSDISIKQKDFKKAYYFQNISHQIEDSLFRNEQNYIVHDLEAKYLKKEQDLTITELELTDENNKLRIKEQKRTISIGAISLGLVSLLSFFLFRFGRKIKSQNIIIEKSLTEKELLLKEIHHRVKNNLQVVSSLLSLQSEYIKDDSALSAINEGRNRVRSMALIHQNLYSEDNLTGINVKSYLEKLIEGLFNTYNINEDKITLELNIEDLELDVDTVVPLGLIANELVSNALKHAFTEQDHGRINVSLNISDNALKFEVQDNGKGIDTSKKIEEMESFGYQMISAFKEKLQADLHIDNYNGTSVSLVIENYKQ